LVSVSSIGDAFDIDVLPAGPIKFLLKKINLHSMEMRDCRLFGVVHPNRNIYEIAFTGRYTNINISWH